MTVTVPTRRTASRQSRRAPWRSEAGQAAGLETVPFGILVFIGGLVLVINMWSIIDTRAALDTAARDYLRAYTAAPSAARGRAAGSAAANASLSARTNAAKHLVIFEPTGAFGPCRVASVRLEVKVPALRTPFIGSVGETTVSATQAEIIQPYGVAVDESDSYQGTVCDG